MRFTLKEKAALAVAIAATGSALLLGVWTWHVASVADDPVPAPLLAVSDRLIDDPFPEVDWETWSSVNPDVVGWVTVPGTGISQPVVQAPADNPRFYLDHDVTRAWNPYGCPYLDAGCSLLGFGSPIALVFGHHMNEDDMFARFASYSDEFYAQSHREILLQTPERKMALEVIAVDVVDADREPKVLTFESDEEYGAWVASLLSGAEVVLDPDASPESLVAFCTCSYGSPNERTIVYAEETGVA